MAEAIARIEAGSAALPSVDALFLFLEDLRRDGYRIDARHIAAAQCLLAEARTDGAESVAARRIKFRLAPLIAKSPSQQQDFYRRFDAWHGAPVVAGRIAPAAPPPAGPASKAVKRDPRRRVIASAVAAFLALAVVATWYFWPSPSPPQVDTVVLPPEDTVVPPGEAVDLPQERFEIAEQVVSPFYAGLKAALPAAPLFAFAAWFFIRWRRRLLLMSRGVILGDAPLGSIRLPLKLSDVLFTGPELRASAQDLRRHRYLPTRKLDAWRTVDATARRAGLFIPVYRERPQLPEYVFLIEQNGSNDHLARLFDLAVDRLRDEHVEIQRFHFHTDPRQVQADDPPALHRPARRAGRAHRRSPAVHHRHRRRLLPSAYGRGGKLGAAAGAMAFADDAQHPAARTVDGGRTEATGGRLFARHRRSERLRRSWRENRRRHRGGRAARRRPRHADADAPEAQAAGGAG